MSENTELTKQYEDLLKQKERQAREIQDIREKEVNLESRIRSVHEDYINRDLAELNNVTREHSLRRQEHIHIVRDILQELENNLKIVQGCDDIKIIEDNLSHYKRRVDELEGDLLKRDSKINDFTHNNFNTHLDVDATRKARSDFEAENKNLSDVRAS